MRFGNRGLLMEEGPFTVHLTDLGATRRLAARAASAARPGDVLLLHGPLGAGKSEFARAFLRAASGDPGLEVPSPSYTLVQGYSLPGGREVHHFDLYRLAGPGELAELGWEEALSADGVVLVEWPERLGDRRPEGALSVALAPGEAEEARVATLSGWPGRLGGLVA